MELRGLKLGRLFPLQPEFAQKSPKIENQEICFSTSSFIVLGGAYAFRLAISLSETPSAAGVPSMIRPSYILITMKIVRAEHITTERNNIQN